MLLECGFVKGDKSTMKRIICVEDDEDLREAYELTFQRAGYECRTVENGIELGCLIVEFEPSVLVLDMNMPELDGLSTLKRLAVSKRLRNTRCLVVSGFVSPEAARFLKSHGIPFLEKPVDFSVMIEIVNELFTEPPPFARQAKAS